MTPSSLAAKYSRRAALRTIGAAASAWTLLPSTRLTAAERRWPEFRLRFDPALSTTPYSGRVYVFLSAIAGEPRLADDWFQPEPLLARDVRDLRPGDEVVLSPSDPQTLRHPADWSTFDPAAHRAQGVMRLNPWERRVGRGTGNGFSSATPVETGHGPLTLNCDQLVPATAWPEAPGCRLLSVPSARLSAFHGRQVQLLGMVRLPASYNVRPTQRFPVLFTIPGFGGTARDGFRKDPVTETNTLGVEFIRVTLDPDCPLGHHVFADSASNGPWSTALVREFLPALAAEYRVLDEPRGRLLTGHSSGGWSSLWLQTAWPDLFGGVWSTAPDPVDFRDFQRINIYQPGENAYRDPMGARRPLARRGEQVALWFDDFCRREDVLGPGGQLHSFEAVFSPRGDDGRPRLLWNRGSGDIQPEIAAAWTAFDIRQILQDRWAEIRPQLAGKLHVHMGSLDTFYLDGATALLQNSLRELGSDAVVELHAGRDHGSLLTPELRQRMRQEMAETVHRG